jgi:hypothetical protein
LTKGPCNLKLGRTVRMEHARQSGSEKIESRLQPYATSTKISPLAILT